MTSKKVVYYWLACWRGRQFGTQVESNTSLTQYADYSDLMMCHVGDWYYDDRPPDYFSYRAEFDSNDRITWTEVRRAKPPRVEDQEYDQMVVIVRDRKSL